MRPCCCLRHCSNWRCAVERDGGTSAGNLGLISGSPESRSCRPARATPSTGRRSNEACRLPLTILPQQNLFTQVCRKDTISDVIHDISGNTMDSQDAEMLQGPWEEHPGIQAEAYTSSGLSVRMVASSSSRMRSCANTRMKRPSTKTSRPAPCFCTDIGIRWPAGARILSARCPYRSPAPPQPFFSSPASCPNTSSSF